MSNVTMNAPNAVTSMAKYLAWVLDNQITNGEQQDVCVALTNTELDDTPTVAVVDTSITKAAYEKAQAIFEADNDVKMVRYESVPSVLFAKEAGITIDEIKSLLARDYINDIAAYNEVELGDLRIINGKAYTVAAEPGEMCENNWVADGLYVHSTGECTTVYADKFNMKQLWFTQHLAPAAGGGSELVRREAARDSHAPNGWHKAQSAA